jgi:hypothetical protein
MVLMIDYLIMTQMVTRSTFNSTESFYSWINHRYSWVSIHITHVTDQCFLGIVLLIYSVGGIINGNET